MWWYVGFSLPERPVFCGVVLLRRRLLLRVVAVVVRAWHPRRRWEDLGAVCTCHRHHPAVSAARASVGRLCVGVDAALAGL